MIPKPMLTILLSAVVFSYGCSSYNYDCEAPYIFPSFIGFQAADINTLVLRKYKAGDNYKTLIDTFSIIEGQGAYFVKKQDTVTAQLSNQSKISSGYDYQIYIPARARTVLISDIVSEKKNETCKHGFLDFKKDACVCYNAVYSLRQDNQLISYSPHDFDFCYIYIRN